MILLIVKNFALKSDCKYPAPNTTAASAYHDNFTSAQFPVANPGSSKWFKNEGWSGCTFTLLQPIIYIQMVTIILLFLVPDKNGAIMIPILH